MFVINGKVFVRFLPGFCVIIFAYVASVSFRVRDSRNEAQFAPSLHALRKLFRATSRWLHRIFLAERILVTNMVHGKTKTNMASLILRSFFCQSFSDILKFNSVSFGPLSHVRSRQKLQSLSNEFTHVTRSSCLCLLHHFNFEREQSAPKLPQAAKAATCT